MKSNPLLVARAITMWRGDRLLLSDLDVVVHGGRVLHVRGANGFGKTTLLRILSGLLPAERGSMAFGGEPFPSARTRAAAVVGYLGHIDGLKLDLSAIENLRFATTISGASASPTREPVRGPTQDLGIASELDSAMTLVALQAQRDVPTRHLSAGQRRRLAIARLITGRHRLWVLDEPFTTLDNDGVTLLCEQMRKALEREVGIVITSHQRIPLPEDQVDFLDLGEPGREPPDSTQQSPAPRTNP